MDELPSARFRQYEVKAVLGRGGMGTVYVALDKSRGQEVALKCLSLERLGTERDRVRYIALFEREFYALSQLDHPHIVRAFDFGLDELGPYYTMELLRGENLRARAPWPWATACSLLRDIASALSLLHARSLVHRDVTPLNVYCQSDGRAKLIDFGAMMPAGVPKQVVGTPAFIAPECLEGQSVDGRTDLFAFGACLYYALTGQHAYPARTLSEVRRMWRTPPRAVSSLAPDVPPALEELVHALLHLRPESRPRTAADVYERLCVIAGLGRDAGGAVASAYLSQPKLVGRSQQERSLRRLAQQAADGAGGSVLLTAARGLGRTRMLDAAARQAQLAGLRIARADASAGALGRFAVAQRLLAALAEEDAQLEQTLGELGMLTPPSAASADAAPRREERLQALVRALRESCERAPCALLVDDLHAIDEPSLALLAELSTMAGEQPLLIVAACTPDAAASPGRALSLLVRHARELTLAPLMAEETRELLVSLFGDVPNIDLLASLMQQHAKGVPERSLRAAQACLACGLIRREGSSVFISAGKESLARVITDHSRPEQALSALSPEASALLSVIALDRYEVLEVAGYQQLLGQSDARPLFRALTELRDARRVEWLDARVRLAHESERQALTEALSDLRRRELQLGMAELCDARQLPRIFAAHYLLAAGELQRAVAAMDDFNRFVDEHPYAEVLRDAVTLETTDRISRLPLLPGAHPALRAKYGSAVVLNAVYQGKTMLVADRIHELARELTQWSGVADYAALAELPPEQRLIQALTRASERCAQPGVGALDVVNALRRQTQLSVATAVAAGNMQDPALLSAIPDLSPFQSLSPALSWTAKLSAGLSCHVRGQLWAAQRALRETYEGLRGPVSEQLEPLTRMALTNTSLAYLCGVSAELGRDEALALADEHARTMPEVAESHRCRYYLARGDLAAAAAARRRSELQAVRAGTYSDIRIVELPAELSLYAACDDGVGLARARSTLRELCAQRPGFAATELLAQALCQRSQGQPGEALETATRALAEHAPPHAAWQFTAALQVELLQAAGQTERALALGTEHLQRAKRAGLPGYRLTLALASACLHGQAPQLTAAEGWLSQTLAELEHHGVRGVMVGRTWELAARSALAAGDRAGFEQRSALCQAAYELGDHPALRARYNALRRDAERLGLPGVPTEPPRAAARAALRARLDQLVGLLTQHGERADFHLGLLDVLIDQGAAVGGVLYLRRERALTRLAAVGGLGARAGLDELVSSSFTQPDEDCTVVADAATMRVSSADLDMYSLERSAHGEAFVVVLETALLERRRIPAQVLREIGECAAARGTLTLDSAASVGMDTEDLLG